VGTEHMLLGLVREDDPAWASHQILTGLGVSLESVRQAVMNQVTRGPGNRGQDMQLTPRAKKVVDLAHEEASLLRNNYIGTEHLLLGLVREGDGLGARVLTELGITLGSARQAVRAMQGD